ncbi:DUF3443 domain-containing protein [Paraburkholderia sprentiae WSM5005]|uniref:DUF3443 domain-containing protein n=1 Tax=Paraburkholderia sprentiae WSM5005 TaxID=754502 RepID=A0A1I9YL95_9BURK|nr:DUF3443 family protein [Paraburkholderia sprentiae]APA87078.1 DUF3443 domain-containing protein [Paraburkholderia sprentiae WSM5005]
MRNLHKPATVIGWMRSALATMLVATLAACGGGGGDSGPSAASSNASRNSPGAQNSGSPPLASPGSSASGNSPSALNNGSPPTSPSQPPTVTTAVNTVPITVSHGVSGAINTPMISVTICAPGSAAHCQTIDNILLDTGSFGLRVVSSVLNPSLLKALPVSTIGSSGAQLAECAEFGADSYTWGTVRTATITVGGEMTTTSIPMQIIGDKSASTVPGPGCSNDGGSPQNTVATLHENGILGVGTAPVDCGATCANAATAANYSNYFACPGGTSCTRTAAPLAQQVANPVAHFPVDNNGVIVRMAPVANTGAATATGTLVFGIGTQSDNPLAASHVFKTDPYGNLNNSVFNGRTVPALIDSGTTAYLFSDSSLAQCGGYYCPPTAQTRSLTLVGIDKVSASASIDVVSATTLFGNSTAYAFNDLAAPGGGSFNLGLPFFYGRAVYYGIDNTASGGQSPYVGF